MKTKLVALFRQLPLVLCALLFAFSAIAKAMSVAEFEMYIYDFQILPFNMSALLARCVIGAELMLALVLLFPLKIKRFYIAEDLSLCLIGVFSIFLVSLVIAGNETNCHCMGVVFDLNPTESLIKNVLVVILLLFGRYFAWHKEVSVKRGSIITFILLAVSMLIIFIWKPADFMRLYKEQKVRTEALREYLSLNKTETFADDGYRMIAVYTSECPMCKRAAKKFNAMAKRNPIDSTRYLKLMMINESIEKEEALADLDSFLLQTGVTTFNLKIVDGDTLSKISPKAPTFIFMDGDSVLFSRGYKSLLEDDVKLIMK